MNNHSLKYSKKETVLNICIGILIVISFFYLLDFISKRRRDNRMKAIAGHQQTGLAKVIDQSFNKGHSVKYVFYYKNVQYENWMGDYPENFKLDHCYTVWFDSTDPKTAYISLPTEHCP